MDEPKLIGELAAIVGGVNVVARGLPDAVPLPTGWTDTQHPTPNARHSSPLPALWTNLPLATVVPGSVEEIVSVVRCVEAVNTALVVLGGGTQLQTGYPPREDKPYLLLSTQRLNRILDYQPDDMTITCEPGVTLAQLQAEMTARRQMLALDTPLPARATLGGIVSTNQSGFWRAAFGAPRDLVIGVRAVMTDGAQVKGGGKVVKNVAGYDVCKLFTGAWGTVGVITEITFRIRPLPEAARVLRLNAPDLATGARAAMRLHHAQLAPTSLLVTNEIDDRPCLLVLLQGPAARMDWQTDEIARQAGEGGLSAPAVLPLEALNQLRDTQSRQTPDTPLTGRIACLLTETEPLLQKLQALPGLKVTADCAMGIVSFAIQAPDATAIQTITNAVSANAHLQWTRIDAVLSDRLDVKALNVWGQGREDATLQRALKQSLDPKGTFSPGRFIGRV